MTAAFPFTVDIAVRGYEIDSFGHVNNAVYLQWLEHMRWEGWRSFGTQFVVEGVLPVVRHVEMDFRAETVLGDTLRLILWPRQVGNTSLVFGQAVRIIGAENPSRIGKLALVAKTVMACTRPGEGKAPVPEAWRAHFPATDPGAEPPL
jgi:YbgC/YbaW family acyl-CoA thioester hydrolase